jgi:hypothetical protein
MAEKATAAVLDFTDTKDRNESGVNKKRVPAGDYLATVTRVEDRPTKETKEAQWMYVISLDSIRGTGYPYYCKLQANQLWKVRNLFLAGGLTIPKKKVKLDPNRVVGKKVAVTMEDDEYDGKLQSVIAEIFPPSELEDTVDSTDEDEEEYDDEEAEDTAEEPEEEEEEDEEEEEPEPAPAPKRRTAAAAKKAAPAKASIPRQRKAEPEVSDDELDELDLDEI